MVKNEENELVVKKKVPVVQWDYYVYTIILSIIHLIFGLNNSCFGPSFVDFKYVLGTTLSWISLFPSLLSLGYMIGSLFGYLYKYLNRQITLIIFISLMGFSTSLLPFSQTLSQFYTCVFGYGLGSGVWFSAYNVWVIEIWQQNSAPVLQLSQFMYGIGTIFGPLIDQPYLTGELIHSLNNAVINTTENITDDHIMDVVLGHDVSHRRNKLHTPFLIIGCLEFIGPILLLTMYFIKPYSSEAAPPVTTAPSANDNPKSVITTQPNNQKIAVFKSTQVRHSLLVALLSNFVAVVFVSDNIYLKFSATYFQYIPLQLNASESAALVVQMAIVYTIGRAITVIISLKLKPQTIISYHMVALMIAMAVLSVGHDRYDTLWLGAMMMSFGFSALLPAIFAFVGQYVEVNNKLGTVIIFNCGILNAFIPFILGSYIEIYPNIFLSIIMINFTIAFALLATILFLTNVLDEINII